MPMPASNDPVDPDAIGGSERDLRRASLAIRWFAVAALAVALSLFYILSASAGELFGRVVSVHDGDTLTLLVDRRQVKVRLVDIDAPELKQAFGTRSRQSLAELCAAKDARIEWQAKDRYGRTLGCVTYSVLSFTLAACFVCHCMFDELSAPPRLSGFTWSIT